MDLRTAKSLSPREYHARRAASRSAAREALRQRKLSQVREAICRLSPGYPAVRRVYLFGSLLRPGRFHAASDIDVALECDDLEAETPFARSLERELAQPGAFKHAVRSARARAISNRSPRGRASAEVEIETGLEALAAVLEFSG